MADFEMKQGRTYKPEFTITFDDKIPTEKDVKYIHFLFRNVMKTFPSEDVALVNGNFVVNLSSKDTLSIPPFQDYPIECIVVFPKGEIKDIEIEEKFSMLSTAFNEEVFRDA